MANKVGEDDTDEQAPVPSWQDCYQCLLLLERIVAAAPDTLAIGLSLATHHIWRHIPGLLLHRHAWIRTAAARLLGAGLASSVLGPSLLPQNPGVHGALVGGGAAHLAMLTFRQLERGDPSEALLTQATKNLVFLVPLLYDADLAAKRIPADVTYSETTSVQSRSDGRVGAVDAEGASREAMAINTAGSDGEGTGADWSDGGDRAGSSEEDPSEQPLRGSLTLHGLVHRVAALADDKTWPRQRTRRAALCLLAALASRLGPDRVRPYLPVMLRPLVRILDNGAPASEEVIVVDNAH